MSDATRDLIELGDIDELVRHADRLTDAGEWAGLLELRDLSRAAFDLGRQLWPVAARAEYRLALDAPGVWAAKILVAGTSTGRFALGPLPEVAASTHRWDELAPHVIQGIPDAAIAAHERVVRGEDLSHDRRLDPFVLEVPLALEPWEPAYPLAEYEADDARFPSPRVEGFVTVSPSGGAREADDHEAVQALAELATAWNAESNGRSNAVAVQGDALAAIGALGVRTARMAPIAPREGLALMAWTAASGGAHGRRRGMAAGRFAAWWAACALSGLLEDFPPDPSEVGDAIGELQWWAWDSGGPEPGWSCRLAIEDPADGLAWAIDASDDAKPD